MVVGAFPIAKLSVLLVKQISKPIANVCKVRAKNSPFFRTYVCMPPAQFYNWCEVKAKMWILNLGKPVNIPVLSQEMAIELGANLLGESVIFIIGAGLLIIEYNRQSKKETAKELSRAQEMQHITSTITDLYFTVQRQQTQLREMERIIVGLNDNKPLPPPPSSPPVQSGTPPSSPGASLNPPKVSETSGVTPTPYPNKGFILQSLNYIQMDAFSSIFPKNSVIISKNNNDTPPQQSQDKAFEQKHEPAVVTAALYNIENNFRSLF